MGYWAPPIKLQVKLFKKSVQASALPGQVHVWLYVNYAQYIGFFQVGYLYITLTLTGGVFLYFLCRLIVVGSVYLILGFLYQRFAVGAQGLEQIPNYGFWKDFGSLQAVSSLKLVQYRY